VQRVAVGLAINGDGLDAQLFAGTNYAESNLSAISDENLFKHVKG
jgi:hypothetical protein